MSDNTTTSFGQYLNSEEVTSDMIIQSLAHILQVPKIHLTLTSVEQSPGSSPRDGFTSVMKALKVTVEVDKKDSKVIHLMAKCGARDSPQCQWWHEMRVFPRECQFYSKLLPALNQIQVQHGLDPLAFPQVPYAPADSKVIIMENLKASGYTMADAKTGLDLDQVKLVLQELAAFHAAGHQLLTSMELDHFRREYPLICDLGLEGLMPVQSEKIRQQSMDMFGGLAKASLSTINHLRATEEVVERFEKFLPNLTTLAEQAKSPEGAKVQVVCKADCWTNNFMFNDSGVKFVDCQAAMRGRPTYDVAVLFCTSTTPELRTKHQDDLFKHYLQCFNRNVKAYGYPDFDYTYDHFIQDYNVSFGFGFFFGLVNLETLFGNDPMIVERILALVNEASQRLGF